MYRDLFEPDNEPSKGPEAGHDSDEERYVPVNVKLKHRFDVLAKT